MGRLRNSFPSASSCTCALWVQDDDLHCVPLKHTLGCFPSSAKFGLNISNYAPYNTTDLWFDLALVRYAELTSHHYGAR